MTQTLADGTLDERRAGGRKRGLAAQVADGPLRLLVRQPRGGVEHTGCGGLCSLGHHTDRRLQLASLRLPQLLLRQLALRMLRRGETAEERAAHDGHTGGRELENGGEREAAQLSGREATHRALVLAAQERHREVLVASLVLVRIGG